MLSGCGWVRGSDSNVLSRLRDEAVVHPGFLSQEEEDTLTRELEPQLRRRRYEYDHWDAVSGRSGELRGLPLGHNEGAGSSEGQSEELDLLGQVGDSVFWAVLDVGSGGTKFLWCGTWRVLGNSRSDSLSGHLTRTGLILMPEQSPACCCGVVDGT